MAIIAPIEMPEVCAECPFMSRNVIEIPQKGGLYKKVCKCNLAPDGVLDPYRSVWWRSSHKEEWCPLTEYPGENEEVLNEN